MGLGSQTWEGWLQGKKSKARECFSFVSKFSFFYLWICCSFMVCYGNSNALCIFSGDFLKTFTGLLPHQLHCFLVPTIECLAMLVFLAHSVKVLLACSMFFVINYQLCHFKCTLNHPGSVFSFKVKLWIFTFISVQLKILKNFLKYHSKNVFSNPCHLSPLKLQVFPYLHLPSCSPPAQTLITLLDHLKFVQPCGNFLLHFQQNAGFCPVLKKLINKGIGYNLLIFGSILLCGSFLCPV